MGPPAAPFRLGPGEKCPSCPNPPPPPPPTSPVGGPTHQFSISVHVKIKRALSFL